MGRGGKQQLRPKPVDKRPVNERGVLFQAEKLTGNRAQRGNLPGGTPRWTYEVKWKGGHRPTYEPAECLVGWEAEMHTVDEEYVRRALLPKVNPLVEAQKKREAAARLKVEDMMKRKERLQRLARRRARLHGDEFDASENEGEESDDEFNGGGEALNQEAIVSGKPLNSYAWPAT
uniref:Chromo domain-containing protein n=1 Tax=Coccolithus braarudii TaxID=221442 RepID=A0A7S0Q489_9EUKA|mmetsp:Transcript_40455/g.86292  ORF Transcript_40455/g.86292 Transcript_40455/m.86292 type:complete len:175 (+) Transcript_40455:199-723(+)